MCLWYVRISWTAAAVWTVVYKTEIRTDSIYLVGIHNIVLYVPTCVASGKENSSVLRGYAPSSSLAQIPAAYLGQYSAITYVRTYSFPSPSLRYAFTEVVCMFSSNKFILYESPTDSSTCCSILHFSSEGLFGGITI